MPSINVSAETFEGEYPLTVPGVLHHDYGMVWFETADGKTWQVNGNARRAHQPIDPIWKLRNGTSTARVDIGPLIRLGLGL